MSGALVLDQVLAHLREHFPKAEVATIAPYGGEFAAEEVGRLSYTCPAILVTVLGWRKPAQSTRLAGRHVRELRLAAFVVTKHAQRDGRMRLAMTLADKLCLVMMRWRPEQGDVAVELAPLEDEPRAENLYGRGIDQAGQALWLVDWTQCARTLLPPADLYDLLSVDIRERVREGRVPEAAAPATPPITVTDEVTFAPLPPTP